MQEHQGSSIISYEPSNDHAHKILYIWAAHYCVCDLHRTCRSQKMHEDENVPLLSSVTAYSGARIS